MASVGEECYSGGEDDDALSYQTSSYYPSDDDDDVDSNVDGGGDSLLPETDNDDGRYRILSEGEVRARQDADTAKVSELFAIPAGVAAVLLRHYKWSLDELQDGLFSSSDAAAATGVSLDGAVDTVVSVNAHPLVCAICFDEHAAGEMRSTGCRSHFYCLTCWRGYAHAAVLDGARCLSLRCPDTSCSAAVVRELLDEIADDDDRARYANFLLRSYVEEGTKFKWCPGPGCGGGEDDKQDDVECGDGHAFCYACGEEAHRPASCETVAAWTEKNAAQSKTASWVLANAKHCPKCRNPIEKNHGCMHMTCRPPCLHEFCWLCLGPWAQHKTSDLYSCNVYDDAKANGEVSDDKLRRRQGMTSLDRYVHFYERWAAHGEARQSAMDDMAHLALPGGSIDKLSAATGLPATAFTFFAEAYKQIAECRRVLRWTYAYGYYHLATGGDGDDDERRRTMVECAQGEAERQVEKLHDCAENDRKDLEKEVSNPPPNGDEEELEEEEEKAKAVEMVVAYRQKLVVLTGVCRNFFRNLLKPFQDGLSEVGPAAGAAAAAVAGVNPEESSGEPANPLPSSQDDWS